ncbi:hypothetical protein [Brevundimonas sp.]|uniref:hypothetical protein n=2 Tax=Brevundimonas sp. TaxID=1871086 RepID=UPI0027FC8532|nr:hypothetical protein [Brevundimonas sp.]MDQ7812201.1 hypothetical protein [Brevundimonas sp.]
MRKILLLGAAFLPLAACQTYTMQEESYPPSLQLQTEPAPESGESILDEIEPPTDLLSGGEAGRPPPPPSVTVRGYRFHDHRAGDASGRFLGDLDAAIAVCDEAAYNAARERWLARTYEAEAQERRSTAVDAAWADSAAKRAQDAAELERLYRERPRYPFPCPPRTAALPTTVADWALATAGWAAIEIPVTGIGFQRPYGGDERFALETDDKIEVRRLGVEASFQWSGFYPTLVGLEYGQGDGGTAGEVPAGTGIDTGIVFNALSPAGSSGFNVGDRGSQNVTDTELDYWHLYAKAFLPFQGPVRPFVYADYLRSETRHDMSYFYEGTGGGFVYRVEQDRMQTIEDQAFGGGIGLLLSRRFGRRWEMHALGSVGGLFRESELDSREHNRANFGPLSDQDFVIERRRSADGFGITGTLALGVEYRVSPRLSLGLGAHVTTLEEVGAVYNPQSGDEVYFDGREVDLMSGRATSWGGQVALRYRFGAQPIWGP